MRARLAGPRHERLVALALAVHRRVRACHVSHEGGLVHSLLLERKPVADELAADTSERVVVRTVHALQVLVQRRAVVWHRSNQPDLASEQREEGDEVNHRDPAMPAAVSRPYISAD